MTSLAQRVRLLAQKLIALPKVVAAQLSSDPTQAMLAEHLHAPASSSRANGRVLTIAAVEDSYFLALFGTIANEIRRKQPVRVELFFLHSLSVGESASVARFANARLLAFVTFVKWRRLYRSFADATGYRSSSILPISDIADFARAWSAWRKCQSKAQVLDLTISGVPVGDLVNDTFLRFKPSATLATKDCYLLMVLWQAFRDVRRARRYFVRGRQGVFLTSYSAYVQHGIAVRVALSLGVRVFSFGNLQEFSKELTMSDWLHTKNPDRYAEGFEMLEDQQEKLKGAEDALRARLAGQLDSATAYMKKSSYAYTGDACPNVAGSVVVFLHDFFDSPHIYRDMVFSEFWDWACFTIDVLTERGLPFHVKPHPNQIGLSSGVVDALVARYPSLSVIPTSVTNLQLASAGMVCAVTIYGTVGHEMAFMGVPTVACARHPHSSFSFCRTASSKAEYRQMLMEIGHYPFDADKAKAESLKFFHMHNRDLSTDGLELRDCAQGLRSFLGDSNADPGDARPLLRELAATRGFQAFVDERARDISQGPLA